MTLAIFSFADTASVSFCHRRGPAVVTTHGRLRLQMWSGDMPQCANHYLRRLNLMCENRRWKVGESRAE